MKISKGGTEKEQRGRRQKKRGGPGFPRKGVSFLFPEPPGRNKYNYRPSMTAYKIKEAPARWPSLPGLEPGTSGLEVQRARPLRHRDLTTHTASAPELKKHIPSASPSHLSILLSERWGDRDSWKIWSGDLPAGSIKAFLNTVGPGVLRGLEKCEGGHSPTPKISDGVGQSYSLCSSFLSIPKGG